MKSAYIFVYLRFEIRQGGLEEGLEAVVGASGVILELILLEQLMQALDREVPWDLVVGADLPQQLFARLLRPL